MDLALQLSMIHCTLDEIAAVMKCHVNTLRNNAEFMETNKRGREAGKASLRRVRWKYAMEGHAGLIMFLSNILLNENPRADLQVTVKRSLDEYSDAELENLLKAATRETTASSGSGKLN